jgi:hypothetical protein
MSSYIYQHQQQYQQQRTKRGHEVMICDSDEEVHSPKSRTKKQKQEQDMASLGYYSDPNKPNLFILSPGPGFFEVRARDHQVAPFKRHISKVRAILAPRSQSLFTTSLSPYANLPLYNPPSPPRHLPLSSTFLMTGRGGAKGDVGEEGASSNSDHSEDPPYTDDEILSSLASLASYDDHDMDNIFLHFNEE